ncbi:acetyltransferase (plasmid) [Aliivibrio salmonicida LFI1238]|uniref:Acetyltransferase n=2 Tax=Aliivibrio salmonicida TaxID=40269 RepID=B6ET78_ALISL|nr:acyltransferase [Aliivibrio salmonicida]CAQ76622.1 acetyltransferase [Aliivibrio salmonicida LFI1238]CDQ51864.1 acetyltransferase [Aliivibrio salmonicida]
MIKNNFDILRIVLALIVMLFHIGGLANIPVLTFFPGGLAVKCFFVISGFLITKSYLKNNGIKTYIKSRFMRVYPLYFVVIITSFLIGLVITSYDYHTYLVESLRYLASNLVFLNFLQPTLPGVFTDIGNHSAVNGSLWTIKVEVMFYISIPIIYGFFTKFFSKEKLTILIFILSVSCFYVLSYIINEYGLNKSVNNQLPSLMSYFMVGAYLSFVGLNSKYIKGLLLPSLLGIYSSIELFMPLSVGILTAYLAFYTPQIKVDKKVGDLSYGIYIWHFPVIQLYLYLGLFSSPLLGVFMVTLTVGALAYISWHYLENRIIHRY